MTKEHYYGIDWLRVGACFGIVMMHIQANNTYAISGIFADKIIPSFANFVFLFMVISAFGMCSGYYERIKNEDINWILFYKKRYIKVLPFFSVEVLIDIIINHNSISFIEAVPNLTLTRGFFPNDIEQIGVAWFLGLIFVFYAIFPLFYVFISSKKKAWMFFWISILLNFVVANYFGIRRDNIIYSLPFFLMGGLIYLYKENLQKMRWYFFLPITIISIIIYYFIGENVYTWLWISAILLIQAIVIRGGTISTYHSSVELVWKYIFATWLCLG
jgi:peptidoglycan/LPS O-acetylase OafA/YrhL